MSLRIRPGKVTCAGLVGIMMVLPNSIWQDPDAKVQPKRTTTIEIERKITRGVGQPRNHLRGYTK
jgi:hypothetical protein